MQEVIFRHLFEISLQRHTFVPPRVIKDFLMITTKLPMNQGCSQGRRLQAPRPPDLSEKASYLHKLATEYIFWHTLWLALNWLLQTTVLLFQQLKRIERSKEGEWSFIAHSLTFVCTAAPATRLPPPPPFASALAPLPRPLTKYFWAVVAFTNDKNHAQNHKWWGLFRERWNDDLTCFFTLSHLDTKAAT